MLRKNTNDLPEIVISNGMMEEHFSITPQKAKVSKEIRKKNRQVRT
jgi:hypothetical protein